MVHVFGEPGGAAVVAGRREALSCSGDARLGEGRLQGPGPPGPPAAGRCGRPTPTVKPFGWPHLASAAFAVGDVAGRLGQRLVLVERRVAGHAGQQRRAWPPGRPRTGRRARPAGRSCSPRTRSPGGRRRSPAAPPGCSGRRTTAGWLALRPRTSSASGWTGSSPAPPPARPGRVDVEFAGQQPVVEVIRVHVHGGALIWLTSCLACGSSSASSSGCRPGPPACRAGNSGTCRGRWGPGASW